MKNGDLIGLKVANDGLGLRTALETQYDITELKHIGNFVFRAKLKDQTSLKIQTKPVELAAFHIRIVSMCPPRKNRQKTQAKKRMKRMTSMI